MSSFITSIRENNSIIIIETNGYLKVNEIQKSLDQKVLVCYLNGYEGLLLELVQTL